MDKDVIRIQKADFYFANQHIEVSVKRNQVCKGRHFASLATARKASTIDLLSWSEPVMRIACMLILALISTCKPAWCQSNDNNSRLDKLGLYEETVERDFTAPDTIANLGLFHGLSKIHVYDSVRAKEPKVDVTKLEEKLRRLGVTCLGSQLALSTDSTWMDFKSRPNHSAGTLNCVLSLSDVIKLERKPLKKYRLTWWFRRVEAATIQQGFDKLSELLISDFEKSRKLLDSNH